MTSYLSDVAVLARKDLLLELRSRDTVPAMLLFVVSALVVFHFALPSETAESDLAASGLLWVAILFTALLGLTRAFVAEREQGLIDALVLAPCDRSAIWLAKTVSVVCFLLVAEAFALPAFALFFSPVDGVTVAAVLLSNLGIAAVALLLGYEHALVSPRDWTRLNTAFFAMNGVISVVFFAFVLGDALA